MIFWNQPFDARKTYEEELIDVYNYSEGQYTRKDLAVMFDTTESSIRNKLAWLRKKKLIDLIEKPAPKVEIKNVGEKAVGDKWSENSLKGSATMAIVTTDFLEIEDALKTRGIDQEKWEVVSFKRSSWTTPIAARTFEGKVTVTEKLIVNYSIKINFKLRKINHTNVALEHIIKKLPKF